MGFWDVIVVEWVCVGGGLMGVWVKDGKNYD